MVYRRIQLTYRRLFPTGTFRRKCGDTVAICLSKANMFSLEPKRHFDSRLEKEFLPITFKKEEEPEVSIIIPVYNKVIFTYTCLKSILTMTQGVSYEVVVVDNASSDKTTELGDLVGNITVVRNGQNLGFVDACNIGAQKARGKYLLFLNNDTKVLGGWLKALVDTAKSTSKAGIVGGKLIYPTGRLQEAGGIVWNDPERMAWNFGNGQDPDYYEFNYLKEVDYCSGACLLISKDIFSEAGGFSREYAPAYCEDTDLAFTVRKLGYKVIYQPKCEILHFEGATAGKDTSQGMKKYQVLNMEKFYTKWKHTLAAEHFRPGENVFQARDRSRGQKTMLFIDHCVPTHDKDAGSLSTYMYLRLLAGMGLKMIFAPENKLRLEPYTTELQQMGIEVVYGKADLKALIAEKGKYLDYVLLSRPTTSKYVETVRKYSNAKIIYNMHDLHYQRELKRFELEKNRQILKEAEKLKEQEHALFGNVDAVLTFSDKEAEYVSRNFHGKKTLVIPLYFYEGIKYLNPAELLKNKRDSIVFLGGFAHLPNVDAAEFLLNDIFPLIRKRLPGAVLYIIGSNPPESLQKYNSQNIVITGFAKDLSEYFAKARVFVAPLRYGAGVKGKIITSMTFGVPSVITSVGNEGLNMEDGVHCMVADDPEKFAAKVIEIYNDDRLWAKLSGNSFNFLKENFSRETAESRIKEALGLNEREF